MATLLTRLFLLLALALLGAGALVYDDRRDELARPGQSWSQGQWRGERLRLLDDGHYEIVAWCLWCRDRLLERGRWSKLGSVVSLVPSGGTPRTLRATLRGGTRHLHDTRAGQPLVYERID